MGPKLIFIFSLPRSGSTWLQRIISSHPDVATTAEPWLLLPLLTATKNAFSIQPYDHDICLTAFKEALSHGHSKNSWKQVYFAGVEAMTNKIYSDLAGNHLFFMDKTPRYSLICDEIIQAFPTAKFIFLWRHPFSIAHSIQKTWGRYRWVMYKFEVDLYHGLFNLLDTQKRYLSKVFSLRYEDLAGKTDDTLSQISRYLGIQLPPKILEKAIYNRIYGEMGDPNRFRDDGGGPNLNWQNAGIEFCNTRFRKQWLRNYVNCIGIERFSQMGYDLHQSLNIIDNIITPRSFGFRECFQNASMKGRKKLILWLGGKNMVY